jgi:dihydroorotase
VTTLTIAGGHVLDPGRGLDVVGDVVIEDGAVVAAGVTASRDTGGPSAGGTVIDASGLLVVPGLVDLHTHLFQGVSHYGVDADRHCLGRGVTTAVDAGSSGAQTFPGFRRFIIEPAETRILAFLHVAVQGLITNLVGELEDTRWASPAQTAARARENGDTIAGIKVRLGYQMVGDDPGPAMRLAREAADETGLPLMVHVIDMRPSIGWLLPHLRRGDIVTHCFHGNPGGILDVEGRLVPGVAEAQQRGVVFDVGHGVGSFSYQVARRALAQGFAADTVSSDLHAHNADGPVWDQATTLSKLLHVGMDLPAVIRSTTATPAAAVRRGGSLGALAPGREADVTVLELAEGDWLLPDAAGESEVVGRLLVPRFAVRAGRVHRLGPPPAAGGAWPPAGHAGRPTAGHVIGGD